MRTAGARGPAVILSAPMARSAAASIVDYSDTDWKVKSYLSDRCELSKSIDYATRYFEKSSMPSSPRNFPSC